MLCRPDFIPYNLPLIGSEEIDEVVATLRSGWLTTGPRVAQFEKEFRAYVGAPLALALNSCTAGLHLALTALGIGPGDEVITTPLTFCATVNTIIQTGATPVLADVGPDGNISVEAIRVRINSRTRALVPVHLGGLPCDLAGIWRLARQHGLAVIEDAAHAAGTKFGCRMIGAAGEDAENESDATVFSFYATKNLTTGEGGMATTANPELFERMRMLCLHGIDKDAWGRYTEAGNWYYEVAESGFKYNLSDIQGAIGIHQLRKLESFVATREAYARIYGEAFAGCAELETPGDASNGRHSWHLYSLRLNLERLDIDRAQFIRELRRRNIGASVHFIPIPLHPFFKPYAADRRNDCPEALRLYPRLVSLPLYPALSEDQVHYIAGAVLELIQSYKKDRPVAVHLPPDPFHFTATQG